MIRCILALVLVVVGCGDSIWTGGGVPSSADSGEFDDGGDRGGDSGLDSGAATDTGTPSPMTPDSPPILAREGTDVGTSLGGMPGCYGEDMCGEECRAVRSCCVGSGECCSSTGADPAPRVTIPSGCADRTPAVDCFGAGASFFGSPEPYVEAGAFVPNGNGDGDSGLLSDRAVDLTVHRATIQARLRHPTDCGAGCSETVAIGMTSQSAVPASARVIAALVYSAARDRMSLVISDSQVALWDAVDGSEWSLELQPSGTITVRRDGEAMTEGVRYQPTNAARVIVYGRSLNPTAGRSVTRLEALSVEVELCDVPDTWTGRVALAIDEPAGGRLLPASGAAAPSLLTTSSETLLAWEQDDSIRVARDTGSGFVADAAALLQPLTDGTWADVKVGDPELVARPAGGYALFFTAAGSAGETSIGRVDLDASLTHVDAPIQVVSGGVVDAGAVSQPTVWVHDASVWLMVTYASDGASGHLRALRSSDGVSWTRHYSTALDALTARGQGETRSRFDTNAITHPALTEHNGAWHLHYTGRRGTRSGVGLLVSDDFLDWRNPNGSDPVLPPGAAADDFVSIAVSAPDVIAEGNSLSIVYLGHDGYLGRLATASRRATDRGSF